MLPHYIPHNSSKLQIKSETPQELVPTWSGKPQAYSASESIKYFKTVEKFLLPKAACNWSVTVSFWQSRDSMLLILCIFGSNWTLYFGWKFLLLLSLPILMSKIHEIRSCKSLNWRKLTVTDKCVRGFKCVLGRVNRNSIFASYSSVCSRL